MTLFPSELACSWHQTAHFLNFRLCYGMLFVILCISEALPKVTVCLAFTLRCQGLLPVLIALVLILESGVPWLIKISLLLKICLYFGLISSLFRAYLLIIILEIYDVCLFYMCPLQYLNRFNIRMLHPSIKST